jgi:hypothetical protein
MNLLYPFENCFEEKEKQHSKFVARDPENTISEYRIDNRSKKVMSKVKVDVEKCIKADGICDYIFTIGKTKKVEDYYLIELKDSDLIKAINQLEKTINHFKLNKTRVTARAVLTKTYSPDVRDARVLKFKDRIETTGGTFKHKSQYLEDII